MKNFFIVYPIHVRFHTVRMLIKLNGMVKTEKKLYSVGGERERERAMGSRPCLFLIRSLYVRVSNCSSQMGERTHTHTYTHYTCHKCMMIIIFTFQLLISFLAILIFFSANLSDISLAFVYNTYFVWYSSILTLCIANIFALWHRDQWVIQPISIPLNQFY